MRRRRKKENVFMWLTFNSVGVLVAVIGLMYIVAKNFGEPAIPALTMMTALLYIPMGALIIGIIGWFFSWNSE